MKILNEPATNSSPAVNAIQQPVGLTTDEAKLRLAKIGPNEPATARRSANLVQVLTLFANPLAIILLIASAISAALGEVINASIIVTMVLLSVLLNFIQTYRSQRAVDRIRKEVAPTAAVLRDGKWIEMPRREVVRGEAGDKLYAESLANILAVHLLRNYTARQQTQRDAREGAEVRQLPHSRAVGDAIRYMQENYARDIQLSDIAAAVHLSAFHLSRLFKQVTGVAPHQYLIQLRVNAARGLLDAGSGQRSLAEVASAVGFADQSHLTRHFKRQFGVTPKHFR